MFWSYINTWVTWDITINTMMMRWINTEKIIIRKRKNRWIEWERERERETERKGNNKNKHTHRKLTTLNNNYPDKAIYIIINKFMYIDVICYSEKEEKEEKEQQHQQEKKI